MMLINCPKCGIELELPNDAAGAKVRCSECGEKFIAPVYEQRVKPFVINETPDDCNVNISGMSTSELSQRVVQIMSVCKSTTNDKEAVSLRNELLGISREIAQRYEDVKGEAINAIRRKVPFFLKPLESLFLKHRKETEGEQLLRNFSFKIDGLINEVAIRANDLVRKEKERQKKIADAERRSANEAEIAKFVGDITKCVRIIHDRRRPSSIHYEHFSHQAEEVVYLVERNVPCIVPNLSNKCKKYVGGTFVVTNKRIVYTSEVHMQTYKIKNIRDFVPCWRLDAGWITIATSDKRRERYKLNMAWFPTLLILFLANDVFREMLLTQDVGNSVDHIWNRIATTQSPLHFKLLNVPFEDFHCMTICGCKYTDASKVWKRNDERRMSLARARSEAKEKYNKGLVTSEGYVLSLSLLDHDDARITLEDKLSGRWDDILAMSAV